MAQLLADAVPIDVNHVNNGDKDNRTIIVGNLCPDSEPHPKPLLILHPPPKKKKKSSIN